MEGLPKHSYVLSKHTRIVAGNLFILNFVLSFFGVFLWTGRNIWNWPVTIGYLYGERACFIGAVMAATLGLVLLARLLRAAGETTIARLGLVAYAVGAVLNIVYELYELRTQDTLYPLIVIYVILAFLGQAAFGISLLKTKLLSRWIGWTTLLWNLGWLVLLPIISPRDLYYPVLHNLMTLPIGIALLVTRGGALNEQATMQKDKVIL